MSLSVTDEQIVSDVALAQPLRRKLAAAMGVVAAGAVMVACITVFVGGSGEASGASFSIGRPVPEVALIDPSRQRVTLNQYRGSPVLLVISEAPLPAALADRVASAAGGHVLLNVHESSGGASSAVGFITLHDVDGAFGFYYGSTALPRALLIDAKGVVRDSGTMAEMLIRLQEGSAK